MVFRWFGPEGSGAFITPGSKWPWKTNPIWPFPDIVPEWIYPDNGNGEKIKQIWILALAGILILALASRD